MRDTVLVPVPMTLRGFARHLSFAGAERLIAYLDENRPYADATLDLIELERREREACPFPQTGSFVIPRTLNAMIRQLVPPEVRQPMCSHCGDWIEPGTTLCDACLDETADADADDYWRDEQAYINDQIGG